MQGWTKKQLTKKQGSTWNGKKIRSLDTNITMAAESLNFLIDKIFWRGLEGEWVKVSAKKFVMAESSINIIRTIL